MGNREELRAIRTFPSLVRYLRDELDWPIETEDFDDLTFDYRPEELGLDQRTAAKVEEIKQLRPLASGQPWGIFFVKFAPKRLPVVALRRILGSLVVRKRASAGRSERAAWDLHDLLFISNFGEGDDRQMTFAHFSEDPQFGDLATLRVLGWDDADTALHVEHAHQELKDKLRWPRDERDGEAWRERWSSLFTLRYREVVTTAKALSEQLAQLARQIRKRVNTILRLENDNGPLRKLHAAFREALIHDLSEDDFADMHAQTITYGLLTARVSRPAGLVAQNVADMVPVTNPFLRDLLSTFLTVGGRKGKIDFDELGVSDVVQALREADMEAVLRDFGDRRPEEDPVIFFYEDFLKAYDPEKKVKRGIFYTPRPVVSFIVHSVHELLQKEFGLNDGLADTMTWAEMVERNKELKIPEGVAPTSAFVQILDPAVGTGTFLVEVIDVVFATMRARWLKEGHLGFDIPRLWNEYVPKHLLPRLHGFELMMAPYAIAHMKIGLKLHETGYRFGMDERVRVYLTNTLEPPQDFSDQFASMAPALAHEAQAVSDIKGNQRFTAVIGNPPYAVNSANKNSPMDAHLNVYKEMLDDERNLKPLNDDYLKFLRCSQLLLCRSGAGVLGMITNHSYTTDRLFRAVRRSLLHDFQGLCFLDLRGETNRDPLMHGDRNVFDIQQGVGIGLYVHREPSHSSTSEIRSHELIGSRDTKYSWLVNNTVTTTPWSTVHSSPPLFRFRPVLQDASAEYQAMLPLNDFFSVGNVGYQTHRDAFVVDVHRSELVARIGAFRDSREDEEQLSRRFDLQSNRDWSVVTAHRALRREPAFDRLVQATLYRPFDIRLIFYASFMIDYDRRDLMQHMVSPNVGLLVSKVFDEHEFTSVFVTRRIVESKVADRTRGSYLFPLRLMIGSGQLPMGAQIQGMRTNLRPEQLARLTDRLGVELGLESDRSRKTVGDIDILNYMYSILHSPEYRSRYAEFLKCDFPRLPLTGSLKLFRVLATLGGQLVALHLMESPKLYRHITTYSGPANPEVDKVSYARDTVWVDKAQARGFRGVPEAVWDFHIGGYQVCEKWLKDRKGRKLSKDDIEHYQRIVVALAETMRVMAEIDKVIEAHGGWPGAFVTDPAPS